MSPAPVNAPVDLVLHAGSGKTGTTSIQVFLHTNRDRLAEHGYLYPRSPGQTRHLRLGLSLKSGIDFETSRLRARQPEPDEASFKRVFRRKLFAEINRSGLSRAVLSDEAVYYCSDESLRSLRRFTDGFTRNVRVVLYLRRQDDHLVSRYQQAVKSGDVRRLAARTRELDLSGLYDHHARLHSWSRIVEPADLVVRRYEPDRFVGGSLYLDFLDAAGIDVPVEDLEHVTNRNESLDAESVEFLRLLNLYRVEKQGAIPGRIDNRQINRRLTAAAAGPALTLPAASLDAFMAQWEESNRRTAIDFLGDPTGRLFRTPRKTANTTTEQRLDPARLDHFLALAELPAHMHRPLRELAEREATG